MAISLIMMSPKGGSGKTTLSLSIASVFSSCGIKTLVIDCDFATNGATVFLEPFLQDDILYSYDIFKNGKANGPIISIANDTFDFVPSVRLAIQDADNKADIKKETHENLIDFNVNEVNAASTLDTYEENYRVIIYDCCAGETEVLHWLEYRMRNNHNQGNYVFAILEYDNLSELALQDMLFDYPIRMKRNTGVMYRKIYNRVSQKEFEELKNGSRGIGIPNPYNIKNDSSARSFARMGDYPKMEKFSTEYKEQIIELCCRIAEGHQDILEKLTDEKNKINQEKKNQEIQILDDTKKIYKEESDKIKTKNIYCLFVSIPALILLCYMVCIAVFAPNIMNVQLMIFLTIFAVILLTVGSFILMSGKQKIHNMDEEIKKIENKLN